MQSLLIALAGLLIMVVIFPDEVPAEEWTSVTPKERCISNLEGTPAVAQCEYL